MRNEKRRDMRRARWFLKRHKPMDEIVGILLCKYTEAEIVEGIRQMENSQQRRPTARSFGIIPPTVTKMKVPHEVILGREARNALKFSARRPLTSRFCNDPLEPYRPKPKPVSAPVDREAERIFAYREA